MTHNKTKIMSLQQKKTGYMTWNIKRKKVEKEQQLFQLMSFIYK